jgi:hypothetical protein
VAGLGRAKPVGNKLPTNQKGSVWQWFALDFGQTILCKRRETLKSLPLDSLPVVSTVSHNPASGFTPLTEPTMKPSMPSNVRNVAPDLFSKTMSEAVAVEDRRAAHQSIEARKLEEVKSPDATDSLSLDRITDLAIRSGFEPMLIGDHLLALAEHDRGIELAVAYAAIIVKARRARLKRA